jgi:molybdate transport system ATP-binding protein
MLTRVNSTEVEFEAPLTTAAAGDRLRLAIRAGDILVATELPRGLSARNVIAGTIRSVSREGAIVRLQVDTGVPVEVHVTPSAAATLHLAPSRDVWLVVKTHSCHPVSAV